MQLSPQKSNPPPFIPFNPNNKFARVDNNPNVRNAQYYTPVVSGYHGAYHPEFGKSPVTSVQMARRFRSKPLNLNERTADYQPDSTSHRGICSDVDWKKILFWTLIALAILLLMIGLFFLIRALLNKGNNENNLRSYYHPDVSPSPAYTSINPINVNPIPYSYIEVPPTSAYVAYNNIQDGYVGTTSTTTTTTTPTFYSQPPITSPQFAPQFQMSQYATPNQPRWSTPQLTETYVNPVDAYNLYHK